STPGQAAQNERCVTAGRANVVESPDEPSGRGDRAHANVVEEGGRPAAADERYDADVELRLAWIGECLDVQAEPRPVRAWAAASGRVDGVGVRNGRGADGEADGQGRREAAEGAAFGHRPASSLARPGDANYVGSTGLLPVRCGRLCAPRLSWWRTSSPR